jgi:hypothetical protein
LRRRVGFGNSGSTIDHSSSSTHSRAIITLAVASTDKSLQYLNSFC